MKRRSVWVMGLLFLVIMAVVVWAVFPDLDILAGDNRIGVIQVRGTISDSMETVKAIKEFRKDSNVKAILVRVDSPGGGVGPSQEIYRELRRTVETKPVVASLGGVAASGGYYIASAASRIIANSGTVTGSIGVIIYFPNLKELFGKIGYQMVTIKSGRFKDVGNPGREMTDEEKALIQGTIDEAERQFVHDVAAGRRLPEEKVHEVADGRIIMGQDAKTLGLVDELGNFEDAVNAAASLGKIEGEPELVYAKKKKRSLLSFLLGSDLSERLNTYLDGDGDFLRYQLPYMR